MLHIFFFWEYNGENSLIIIFYFSFFKSSSDVLNSVLILFQTPLIDDYVVFIAIHEKIWSSVIGYVLTFYIFLYTDVYTYNAMLIVLAFRICDADINDANATQFVQFLGVPTNLSSKILFVYSKQKTIKRNQKAAVLNVDSYL